MASAILERFFFFISILSTTTKHSSNSVFKFLTSDSLSYFPLIKIRLYPADSKNDMNSAKPRLSGFLDKKPMRIVSDKNCLIIAFVWDSTV